MKIRRTIKRALLFHGGWSGHQPGQCAEIFAEKLAGRGFAVTRCDTLTCLDDTAPLAAFSLIMPMWTMGVLTTAQEKNLVAAIEGGVGLAGFHGGMGDAFRGAIGYQWMVGGQFLSHPDGIRDYVVHFVNRDDPITRGLVDFRVHSEQYYLLVDPRNEVLATTTFDCVTAPWVNGTVVPAVWKKTHGAGWVFYSNLGHAPQEFSDVPEQFELTFRGMTWAAR